jgi:hypothetical protein
MMKKSANSVRLAVLAAALLLGGAAVGPAAAQIGPSNFDAEVPCGAFERWAGGAWTAVAPTMLHIDNGMTVAFAPGDTMPAGSTVGGVAVPVILDRHCGNL